MKKCLILFFVLLTVWCNQGYAQESDSTSATSEIFIEELSLPTIYSFPKIKTEISLFAGYRFVDLNGSARVEEYEYLQDSLTLGGEFRLFSFPHKVHLDVDIKSRKDFSGDLTYAYRDVLYFRTLGRSLFHNLDNYRLIDFDPTTSSPGVDVSGNADTYGVQDEIFNFFLRLKTPDFPFHFYVDSILQRKDGRQQLRSLSGSGYFNDIVRKSQKRDIDWETNTVTVGVNSHLGPVEIDVSHGEKRFNVKGDEVFFDTYTPAGFLPPASVRNQGVYPHNLIPEFKSSSNTLKLHTSYTGRFVASATFKTIDKENRDSRAEADYFIGAGDVTWIPTKKIALFLRYRHKDLDIDNLKRASFLDSLCSPSNNSTNTYQCSIKPSISSETDDISGTVRFRPISGLLLRAKYTYRNVARENADAWNLPRSTQKNTFLVSGHVRLLRTLKVKARYTYKGIDDPAYNTEPDRSNSGMLSVSWMPFQRVNTLFSYSITSEERSELQFPDSGEADDRDVKKERFMGNVTFFLLDDLSLTTGYAYMLNRIEQDVRYFDLAGSPLTDPSVPYWDRIHSYLLDIHYIPRKTINLSAGLIHTVSKGRFSPDEPDLLDPASIASFSEHETEETVYSFSGKYALKRGFTTSLEYRYADFNDVLNNPNDELEDGEAHILVLKLSKRW